MRQFRSSPGNSGGRAILRLAPAPPQQKRRQAGSPHRMVTCYWRAVELDQLHALPKPYNDPNSAGSAMDQVTSILFSLSTLESKPSMTNDSWDFTPAVAVIVVILIIGVVAAGWAIKRDV